MQYKAAVNRTTITRMNPVLPHSNAHHAKRRINILDYPSSESDEPVESFCTVLDHTCEKFSFVQISICDDRFHTTSLPLRCLALIKCRTNQSFDKA
uniref:Uncharacterized protein n=1 Tax=Romanomermis culicivorax TaxID=13658 RepID=A0A915JL66_ROMCU